MGCRAIVYFTDALHKQNHKTTAGVYLHWQGSDVRALMQELEKHMEGRDNDACYAAARFCQLAGQRHNRPTGVGLLPPPDKGDLDKLDEYSHGDFGVILIDVTKTPYQLQQFGQYAENDL